MATPQNTTEDQLPPAATTATPAAAAAAAPTDKTRKLEFSSNAELLRYLYADLTRISQVSAPDIVLHRYASSSSGLLPRTLVGAAAAQAHEEALVAATGGTLRMDVESVSANAHFGAVLGVLRARRRRPGDGGGDEVGDGAGPQDATGDGDGDAGLRPDLALPFCGVWRFVDGRAVEHWENGAAPPEEVESWLAGPQ
ncbi:hypothetical protein GGR56DRAFT_671844 [Xylariaceae sp. FL0804]|nr:hypothetical protein GGR56DRAFT_671844 [Xylariaceae sp. FL0804]